MSITDQDVKLLLERYTKRLETLGSVPEALGWTKNRHVLRYHVLLEPWRLTNERLFDFGCGFVDLYAYCRERFPQVQYEGLDLNPDLVAVARQRYPDARLSVANALNDGLNGCWDVIVASGVFNFKLSDNWSAVEGAFDLFSRHARKGFAANFLSNRVDFELDHTFHADPAQVLALAYRHSNRVMLRNDYMPFEFTVYVDMRREFDRHFVVYPEFLPFVGDHH